VGKREVLQGSPSASTGGFSCFIVMFALVILPPKFYFHSYYGDIWVVGFLSTIPTISMYLVST
jgi:hypothetical protein